MHIKQEGQIIIRERMRVIDQDASFEMLHSLGVVTDLEIGETKKKDKRTRLFVLIWQAPIEFSVLIANFIVDLVFIIFFKIV